ncbi:tetratricopeptide repeat protein [Paludisphaera rhizosphaerae]|uniref:tetratricopeptide repeat protein n=1 Tax=Paludisphaera rhizosphaerae TaxID=2711216 RepID=UPI00198123BA|nr:tetratricopeptide repeat protein [Paludisphaera rhizosphaerae]
MTTRILLAGVLTCVAAASILPPATFGQATAGGSGAGASSGKGSEGSTGGDPTQIPAAVSSGWSWYRPYVITEATPNGLVSTLHGPNGQLIVPRPYGELPMSYGPRIAAPPPGFIRPVSTPKRVIRVSKADAERAETLVTFGERLFRTGNFKRAEERLEQALHLNPYVAAPRIRLMQIAVVREQYPLAASLLREAETAEPGWITTASDVQALYTEPAEFARHLAKLEAHLHQHPEDRDAWLVLGAQLFLSRRESKAADVFLRLDEPRRKPDIALAAFLDAARLRKERKIPPPPSPAPGVDPFQPPAP